MKIERISDNQIKCTLNRSDLASRQIKMSELAYGTEKARGLFQDMMAQAENEVGFYAKDLPLMVEAIPVSMDCVVLMITKVEDPDEMEPGFSDFAKIEDSSENEGGSGSTFALDDKSFKNLLEEVDNAINKHVSAGRASAVKADVVSVERIFSFDSLDDVIDYAHRIGQDYSGSSYLYKNREDGRYYLKLERSGKSSKQFEIACVSALEYGRKEASSFARAAYFSEHCESVLEGTAIQSLAAI